MLYARFMAMSSELENIQAFLYRLRQRYLYKPRLVGAGVYLIWVWLSLIIYLALAYPPWYLMLAGLTIPAAYGTYSHLHCPSLDDMVTMIDRRCKFEQRLVTVWQYRNSQEPVLPLLSKEVVRRMSRIDMKAVFPLKINPRLWLIPLCLLIVSIYFWRYPLIRPLPPDSNLKAQSQSQTSMALVQVANQVEQFSEQLARSAGSDPARQSQEAEKLKEISRDIQNLNNITDPAKRAQEVEAIKQKLSNSMSSASQPSAAPPVPQPLMDQIQTAEPEQRPWLEFEIKSKHLMKLMEEMEKLGLNGEQIKSQFLRDIYKVLDSIIRFKAAGGNKQLANTPAAPGDAGAAIKLQSVQIVRGADINEPGVMGNKSLGGNLPPIDGGAAGNFTQTGLDQEWQGRQHGTAPPGLDKLAPAYRNQVQSIIKNKDIPKAYQQQVTDYFDAVNNRL